VARTGFPGVDRHRLGAGTLLHARASGALVLAGEQALSAARRARAAQASGRPVPEEGAALLAEWARAGLFLAERRPFPGAAAWRPPRAEPMWLGLGGRRVALACEEAGLAADLAAVLAPLRVEAGHAAAPRVDVLAEGGGCTVFRDRAPSWGRGDVFVSRHLALREVLVALAGPRRVGAVLHAACVARGGRALVLAGDSGAGKSTLALELVGAGWAPVADDLTALDRRGRALPFPTRISLKPGSWPLVAPSVLDGAAEGRLGGGRTRYLDPPGLGEGEGPGQGALTPAALVFPRYEPGAEPAVAPLSPEEALVRLVDSGARLAGLPETAAPLARFLRTARAVALTHGGGAAVREVCAALLDGRVEAA